MAPMRIFAALAFSCLLGTSAALAASRATDAAGNKASHVLPKNAPAAAARTTPQAPIVMGRSVTVHRKTKLHHLKIKPLEAAEKNEKTADNPH